MGKSYRNGSDSRYYDDYTVYSKNEIDSRNHKKEKRVNAALRSQDISGLIDPDDDFEEED